MRKARIGYQLLAAVISNIMGAATAEEIASEAGYSVSAVRVHLNEMATRGFLTVDREYRRANVYSLTVRGERELIK